MHGVYLHAVTFNRDNSDCERINAVTNANLEEGLLTVKDLARILGCGSNEGVGAR